MLGTVNSSYGGLIDDPSAYYTYNWNEFFTATRPTTAGLTYGTPDALGPSALDFASNLQFSSLAGGAVPSDFVDGKLMLDITAKTHAINGITISERGSYSFGFGGTATTERNNNC